MAAWPTAGTEVATKRITNRGTVKLIGMQLVKFSIWHLLLLTLLAAVYVAVRTRFGVAIILVPMCLGAYFAWFTQNPYPSIVMRIRSALLPTVLPMLALLVAELLLEIWTMFTGNSGNQQPIPVPSLAMVALYFLALYTFIGLAAGAIVAVAVHFYALIFDVVRLGISAVLFQREMRVKQELNASHPCPICKAKRGY